MFVGQSWFVVIVKTQRKRRNVASTTMSDNGTGDAAIGLNAPLQKMLAIFSTEQQQGNCPTRTETLVKVSQLHPHTVNLYLPFIFSQYSPCATAGSDWLRSPPSGARCRPAAACRGPASPGKTSWRFTDESPICVSVCH